jgi:hypothetical protein
MGAGTRLGPSKMGRQFRANRCLDQRLLTAQYDIQGRLSGLANEGCTEWPPVVLGSEQTNGSCEV